MNAYAAQKIANQKGADLRRQGSLFQMAKGQKTETRAPLSLQRRLGRFSRRPAVGPEAAAKLSLAPRI